MLIVVPNDIDPETGRFAETLLKCKAKDPAAAKARARVELIARDRELNNATKEIWE
ncbi:MAG: hypothetical protein KKC18_14375 [Chloroflexi bacterium]|nr:hypothetical protein [Chloroflexota bacterium]